VAALRFASAAPINAIETELMQHMRDHAAAGPIRAVAARTRDVVDTVATICRVRGLSFAAEDSVDALGIRLELGVPQALVDLATRVGGALTRANYLDLLANGLGDVAAIVSATDEQLATVIGDPNVGALRAALAKTDPLT
jgi:hypothetical protein